MQRLVLVPDVAISAVEEVARELGWPAVLPAEQDDEDMRLDFVLTQGVRARYVEDRSSDWDYLLVPDAHASVWRDALAARKLLVSRDEALAMFGAARGTELIAHMTLLLGLFAYGAFDEEVFAAIAAALLSLDDTIRDAALTAVSYSNWEQFGPLLREGLKESSAGPSQLEQAREIADLMEAQDWQRPYYAADP